LVNVCADGKTLSTGPAVIVRVAVAVSPLESLTVRVTLPAGVPAGTVTVNVSPLAVPVVGTGRIVELLEVIVYGAFPP
jgi:hypothetical protein